MYAHQDNDLIVFVGWPERKQWWRNLRDGAPVTVRVRGKTLEGFAEVVTGDPPAVAAGLRSYLAKFPRAGRSIGPPERAVMIRISRLDAR